MIILQKAQTSLKTIDGIVNLWQVFFFLFFEGGGGPDVEYLRGQSAGTR